MRSAVDADECQFYQAIIWVSAEKPAFLEQWQKADEWTGTRWFHTTLAQQPNVSECSTALIVFDPYDADYLQRFPDWALTLESIGPLIGTITVLDPVHATNLCRIWHQQLEFTSPSSGRYTNVPIFIGARSTYEVFRILQSFNAFTYAPMLACFDWFDLRVASNSWKWPCFFREIKAETFDKALNEFKSQLMENTCTPLILWLEPDFNLEYFSAVGDVVDGHLPSEECYFATQLISGNLSGEVEIIWLEYYPDE